jgi:hypothetical protein
MDVDSAQAKQHPLISEFLTLVEETVGDGVLGFRDLQNRPFMKFWKHMIIYRFEDAQNDFRVVFYGSQVVSRYDADWTGKLMSEMGFAETYDTVFELNKKIIEGERRVFASGNLHWQGREYRKWHQMKMPLKNSGGANDVLMLVDFA